MSNPEWVIIGCGKGKKPRPAPAADLYTGAYIKASVKWARSVTIPSRILILSAKHGLIRSNKVIAPYQASFSSTGFAKAAGGEPPVDDATIAGQIDAFALSGPVITLAGESYRRRLIAASRGALAPYNPFLPVLDQLGHDHRTGYQAQQLNRWRGRIPQNGNA